ncbi:hypothetical protein BD324DRAFT_648093 [Kockovaella imperatae]|uniref:Uncharacterized protein n=1 Tax=Kockovaella imperatae TaxID=4999 RepID=A0A1Y1UT59_9TREE|nr:hypothetical protein BD324DRAFT_648093 [Kockovaella imperatae]ORX41209.1 hypothetical protein BD324DRAFT_648093 [Kockovaella imperatae]
MSSTEELEGLIRRIIDSRLIRYNHATCWRPVESKSTIQEMWTADYKEPRASSAANLPSDSTTDNRRGTARFRSEPVPRSLSVFPWELNGPGCEYVTEGSLPVKEREEAKIQLTTFRDKSKARRHRLMKTLLGEQSKTYGPSFRLLDDVVLSLRTEDLDDPSDVNYATACASTDKWFSSYIASGAPSTSALEQYAVLLAWQEAFSHPRETTDKWDFETIQGLKDQYFRDTDKILSAWDLEESHQTGSNVV